MAEIKETKTYAIENLTYEQFETIYRALMAFEPEYHSGKVAKEELRKAFQGWV